MSAARRALACAAAVTALAACAQAPEPAPAPGGALPPPQGCEASRVRDITGLQGSVELAEAARTRAGADIVRMVGHDQMVTREYREGRLNLWLDAQGRVREVNCG